MNGTRAQRPRRNRRASVFALLEELLGRDGKADAASEDAKLTRARLALFGCAPK